MQSNDSRLAEAGCYVELSKPLKPLRTLVGAARVVRKAALRNLSRFSPTRVDHCESQGLLRFWSTLYF